MNGNLIDTNIVIKLLNGDSAIAGLFEGLEDIHIPVITVGELHYGASKSSRKESNVKLFNDFISEYPVLGVKPKTAQVYGEIKYALVQQGINIPENDLWIAAIAVSENMKLITCDNHFAKIEKLQVDIQS